MKKPWERGFITPAAAGKPLTKWHGPATPEGWTRDGRTDFVMFTRRRDTARSYWAQAVDRIVGGPGRPWKLWIGCLQEVGVFRGPDMTMRSLDALIAWYAIECEVNPPSERMVMTDTTWFGMGYNQGLARANRHPQLQDIPRGQENKAFRGQLGVMDGVRIHDGLIQKVAGDFSTIEARVWAEELVTKYRNLGHDSISTIEGEPCKTSKP